VRQFDLREAPRDGGRDDSDGAAVIGARPNLRAGPRLGRSTLALRAPICASCGHRASGVAQASRTQACSWHPPGCMRLWRTGGPPARASCTLQFNTTGGRLSADRDVAWSLRRVQGLPPRSWGRAAAERGRARRRAQWTSGGSAPGRCAARWASTAWPWTRSGPTCSSRAAPTRSVRAAPGARRLALDSDRLLGQLTVPPPWDPVLADSASVKCCLCVSVDRSCLRTAGPAQPARSGRQSPARERAAMCRQSACPCWHRLAGRGNPARQHSFCLRLAPPSPRAHRAARPRQCACTTGAWRAAPAAARRQPGARRWWPATCPRTSRPRCCARGPLGTPGAARLADPDPIPARPAHAPAARCAPQCAGCRQPQQGSGSRSSSMERAVTNRLWAV